MSPPSAISKQPPQIQLTIGLWCRRTLQAVSLTGSPSATYTSRITPRSMATSVIAVRLTV
ncbi:hypothetical protein Y695_04793 [Hydrogenophaga sp. T4]|nr:hypothetical protein Y695_04793 [Hydrogenophaga sp. T4]